MKLYSLSGCLAGCSAGKGARDGRSVVLDTSPFVMALPSVLLRISFVESLQTVFVNRKCGERGNTFKIFEIKRIGLRTE